MPHSLRVSVGELDLFVELRLQPELPPPENGLSQLPRHVSKGN